MPAARFGGHEAGEPLTEPAAKLRYLGTAAGTAVTSRRQGRDPLRHGTSPGGTQYLLVNAARNPYVQTYGY